MAAVREARWKGAAAVAGPDVKCFERPDRRLVFEQGSLEAIKVGGRMIGKGSYGPGWKWSRAAGGGGLTAHVGVVLSGRAKARERAGRETDLLPGDCFHLTTATDLRVVGYRPCEILYVSGVEGLMHKLQRQQ